jgi:16S rRNA (guanine527-N7)-methyltransferase
MNGIDQARLAEMLREGVRSLGLRTSDEQETKLLDYLVLLVKWNSVYNLTAVREPEQMVIQHLLDSLAVVPAFVNARNILDVGSGGGLPGIVLAIWALNANPNMRISMIDTVHKKTAFLTQVKAELQLGNVTIYTSRVEQLKVPEKFDVITSRAFAELSDFVKWSAHLLEEDGTFIAMKGVMPVDEVERLPVRWHVEKIEKLAVPGLSAERHLVFIKEVQS